MVIMKIRAMLFLIICYTLVIGTYLHGRTRTKLSIVAASDLYNVLGDIKTTVEARHPDLVLQFSFGASGSLAAQIQQGAPFDIFLSADEDLPTRLYKAGFSNDNGPFLFTIGSLVLWVRNDLGIDVRRDELKALFSPAVSRISIANPKVAPYGKAAESALRGAGIYDQVKAKLVFADNIAQAAHFLYAGAAEAGVISPSQANNATLRRDGLVWKIPKHLYPPIKQAGIILKSSSNIHQAKIFRDFLLSREGQAIFVKHGFGRI